MRIVSLLASATEMIAALGCLDQLVGRSHECDYPPEILQLPLVSNVQIDVNTSSEQIDAQVRQIAQTRESVHENALKALSVYGINVDLLQKLQPDIIFTQTHCEVCAVSERDVIQALQDIAGIQPRVVSLSPYRLSDVWEDLLRVGKALGCRERAEKLINEYQRRLDRLASLTTQLNESKPKPRVTVLEWLNPLMGAGNWTPELIAYAGGEPVFGEIGQHSSWLTWEELVAANPDILLLAPCGFPLERTMIDISLLQQHSAWQSLSAVQQQRVYAIDGNSYLNRSGPRLVESAEILGHILWGEQLKINMEETAWIQIQ